MNIVEVIRRETASLGHHTAIADGPIELTYSQLLSAVDQAAGLFQQEGIRPFDRVAFLCEDCADYIIASLAVLRVGAVVVPVSPSLMGDELETLLERMDVRVLLGDATLPQAAGGTRLTPAPFNTRTFTLLQRPVRNDFPPAYRDMNPAFIRFSSGTTGACKGVLLSHETLIARTDAADQGLQISPADTVIWVLSMSFHFVVTILLYLRRGATIAICRQPFPESFLDARRRRKGTVFYASPFHYQVLATSPLVSADSLSSLRLAISTAMKLTDATADAFRNKFGIELAEAYGIIEIGLPFIRTGRRTDGHSGVGQVQPGYEVMLESPAPDGSGTVLLRGPGMFDAYVSPWTPRADATSDGWFNTGDIGRLNTDRTLTLIGREKNVINFVGMKIFPDEVEAMIAAYPGVKECRVIGVPHPLFGQIPCVEIVPFQDVPAPDPTALRRYCFQHLAAHKVPKEILMVASIERTPSGKIKRA